MQFRDVGFAAWGLHNIAQLHSGEVVGSTQAWGSL